MVIQARNKSAGYYDACSSTSKAQQNISLSSNTIPLPSGAHFISRVSNFFAGTPMHSAISSSVPSSPIHSSLQVYILLVPQHSAKLPFRTGFHRACNTGFVCMRILRNLGLNGSEAEGNVYIWMTVGTFSKRTSSKLPVLFHSSWTAPVLGFGFEGSVRARLID